MRVITHVVESSNDRKEVEEVANFGMLGQAAIQYSAKLARGGMIERGQIHARAWHKHLANNWANQE